jgi:hypothetical protein
MSVGLPELAYGICNSGDIEAQRFRNISGYRLKQRRLVFTIIYGFPQGGGRAIVDKIGAYQGW